MLRISHILSQTSSQPIRKYRDTRHVAGPRAPAYHSGTMFLQFLARLTVSSPDCPLNDRNRSWKRIS